MHARRLRKRTIAAATVGVVLLVVIAGSFCYTVGYISQSKYIVSLSAGNVGVRWGNWHNHPAYPPGAYFVATRHHWHVLVLFVWRSTMANSVSLPLWPFLAVAAFLAVRWYRQDRRVPPGFCACGYNLTGNTSGRCPECGRAVAATEPTP